MKRKIQIITVAAVIMALVMSTTVLATIGVRAVELAYNNIKLMVNGKDVVPADANGNAIEPFIIDGTTYLPVRGVASALGLEVGWDATTNTVSLNTPGAELGGVKVYEDEWVSISFTGCTAPDTEKDYFHYYNACFNITNKTNKTLDVWPTVISFNGVSYNDFYGSCEIAPYSTAKGSFQTEDILPTLGINSSSGVFIITEWDDNYLDTTQYKATWY